MKIKIVSQATKEVLAQINDPNVVFAIEDPLTFTDKGTLGKEPQDYIVTDIQFTISKWGNNSDVEQIVLVEKNEQKEEK